MVLIRVSHTLCSKLSLSFEKDWLLWGWHLTGCASCLFWRSVLQPWQSSCGRCSIWIQTTLNHMPLNLMWMASPGALSAPLQSKGSLPSCIQQSGSRAPWRPGTNTPKLATPLQSSCVVFIFYPVGTGHLKSSRCTAFRGSWNTTLLCSCMKEYTVLNRILSRFLLGILFWCRMEFSK